LVVNNTAVWNNLDEGHLSVSDNK